MQLLERKNCSYIQKTVRSLCSAFTVKPQDLHLSPARLWAMATRAREGMLARELAHLIKCQACRDVLRRYVSLNPEDSDVPSVKAWLN